MTATILSVPRQTGSYALHLVLDAPKILPIGRLGLLNFPAGIYIYAGSAHGPGGLQARLAHHLRSSSRPHWHIDWLLPHAARVGFWITTASGPVECEWAQALLLLPGAFPAPLGFGASDCDRGCPAHLVGLPPDTASQSIESALRSIGELSVGRFEA